MQANIQSDMQDWTLGGGELNVGTATSTAGTFDNDFDIIITLCGDAKDKCPILDKSVKHIHWGLQDPAKFKGTDLEIRSNFGKTRDLILNYIKDLKLNLEKGVL